MTASSAMPALLPEWIREEWLFWMAFASWTVLPSTATPLWTLGDIPLKSTDLLLFPLCFLYLLPRLLETAGRHARGWHRGLPLWLGGMAAFGALSVWWSGMDERNAAAMQYVMAVSAASGLLACLIVASVEDLRGFLWRLSAALAGVALLYTAQSVLSLGLRSKAAVTLNDFGMERVRGPLFESSTGYFLLIPPLAFALQETLARRVRPLYGLGAVFALALAILGMGSRAGYALLALFVFACLCLLPGRRKMAALAVVSVVLAGSAAVIFSKARTDRLRSQARDGRSLMHETVGNMLRERPLSELLTGSGLGSCWPWYLTEMEGGDLYLAGRYVRHTPQGILLYHPHSTVLELGVELGLVGVLFVAVLCGVILAALFHSLGGEDVIYACGVAVSTAALGFDLFLVRRPTRDAVWWILLFGLLAMVARRRRRNREPNA